MGWTGVFNYPTKADGKPDIKKFLDDSFHWESETNKFSVLKSSMVSSTYYAAIQKEPKDGSPSSVFAVVTKTSYSSASGELCYKDMGEDEGPCEDKCPASILKLLTPTDNEFANGWRERCQANIDIKKAMSKNTYSLNKLPLGSRVRYIMPYDTTAYSKGDTVEIYKRQMNGKAIWTDGTYRFKQNILPKEYDVISVGYRNPEAPPMEPIHVSISRQQSQER